MVIATSSSSELYSLDHLQWKPASCHICSGSWSRWHPGRNNLRASYHPKQSEPWLENNVRYWIHDWYRNLDCCVEGHVCSKWWRFFFTETVKVHIHQVLHGMHHRHLRPWELFAEDDDASGTDVELKKASLDSMGSSNSYEDEPWVAKYEKRNTLRKILDRKSVV